MHGMAHVHLYLHMRHAYKYVKIKFFLRLFCFETESYYVDLPAAASQMLGLKACPTMPRKTMRLSKESQILYPEKFIKVVYINY